MLTAITLHKISNDGLSGKDEYIWKELYYITL
jgi:hypothetical protein